MSALTRREAIRLLGGVAIGGWMLPRIGWAAPPVVTAQDPIGPMGFDEAAITRTDFGDGITLLQGPGGNMTQVAGSDGASLLIDCGVPARGADVAAAAAKTTGKMPATLINTHWHFDHAGGNEAVQRAGVSAIVSHDNTLKRLSTPQHIDAFAMDFPASPEAARPTLTFADSMHFRLAGGQALLATYVPNAHTDGDIFLHIDRGDVLVTGDLFFNGLYPVIDVSSNGSIDGMIAGANHLLGFATDKTRIIPGHGAAASKKDLAAMRDMLQTVRDRLSKLVAKGLTLEQAIDAKPLADLDAAWGQRMFHSSHFVRQVYPMLTKAN